MGFQHAPKDVQHDRCLSSARPACNDEVFALPADNGFGLFPVHEEFAFGVTLVCKSGILRVDLGDFFDAVCNGRFRWGGSIGE